MVIIDYQAGNLTSVVRSFKALGVEGRVTQDPAQVVAASRVVFPGVGAAGKAMATLRELGLDRALKECFRKGIPILGICLGAQIVLESSEENDTPCLGLLPGTHPGPAPQPRAEDSPHGLEPGALSAAAPGFSQVCRKKPNIILCTAITRTRPRRPWSWA